MAYSTMLWFDDDAGEAVEYYASVLPDLRIENVMRGEGDAVLVVSFTLGDQRYSAMNGGATYALSPAVSIEVRTDSQEESDRIYSALLDGGTEMACGWVTDRFGLSWQISPAELLECVSDPDPARAAAAFAEMQTQRRIDVAAIRRAMDGV